MIGVEESYLSDVSSLYPAFYFNYMEKYYRYSDIQSSYPVIRLEEFEVIKHTPRGVWIRLWADKKKFILSDTHKKWACPTLEMAKESFIKRKEKQYKIYKAKTDSLKLILDNITEGKWKEMEEGSLFDWL